MQNPLHPLGRAAAAVLLAGAAGLAGAAQTRIDTQLGGCCVKTVIDPAAPVSDSLALSSPSGGTSLASLTASVDDGVLKARVDSQSGGPRAPANAAFAAASISDRITVSNAALTGQAGFAHITLDYTFAAASSGTIAFTDLALRMTWNDARAAVLWQTGIQCFSPTQCSVTNQRSATWAPDAFTPNITLTYGEPIRIGIPIVFGRTDDFQLSLQMRASSGQGFGEGTSTSFVDGAHSVYWGGIDAITDAGGRLVQGLVSSESGVDYTRSYVPSAVPEPGTAAMWIAALLAAAAKRRRSVQA